MFLLGPLKGFLSWQGTLERPLSSLPALLPELQRDKDTVRCCYRAPRSQDTVNNNWRKPWLYVCWKYTFLHRSLTVKSQQNRIELVTRPDVGQAGCHQRGHQEQHGVRFRIRIAPGFSGHAHHHQGTQDTQGERPRQAKEADEWVHAFCQKIQARAHTATPGKRQQVSALPNFFSGYKYFRQKRPLASVVKLSNLKLQVITFIHYKNVIIAPALCHFFIWYHMKDFNV